MSFDSSNNLTTCDHDAEDDPKFLFLSKKKSSSTMGLSPMTCLRRYLENIQDPSQSTLSPWRAWYDSLCLDRLFELYLFYEYFEESNHFNDNFPGDEDEEEAKEEDEQSWENVEEDDEEEDEYADDDHEEESWEED